MIKDQIPFDSEKSAPPVQRGVASHLPDDYVNPAGRAWHYTGRAAACHTDHFGR
jgi:hypothetical protein